MTNGCCIRLLGEASGYVPYTVYMAMGSYMKSNPETIQQFTNAIYKGQQWVATHSAKEIAEVCLPYFSESNVETLTKIVDRYKSQDTWKADPVFDKAGFTLIQDIMETGGELSKRVPFEQFIDTSHATTAVKTIK